MALYAVNHSREKCDISLDATSTYVLYAFFNHEICIPNKEAGMSHQDRGLDIVTDHKAVGQAINQLLPARIFRGIKTRTDATWKPRTLATVAWLWATSVQQNLIERFQDAREIGQAILSRQPTPGTSYQGFIKMLHKHGDQCLAAVIAHLRETMQNELAEHWAIDGHVVFAVDGSKVKLPRTESHEAAYSPSRTRKETKKATPKKKRKKKPTKKSRSAIKSPRKKKVAKKKQSAASTSKKADSPQMFLTLLWHASTGLPWAWRTGPSDSSERGHLQEMLAELPENALITGDAGFVGYDFWKSILDADRQFLIRVGANVRLLRNLGKSRLDGDTVCLWPDGKRKKGEPAMVLRLITLHDGRQPIYLVTNVSASDLSDKSAARIYQARWGIEVFFRTLKQTFGCRKLRSGEAKNARLELDWSLIAIWSICLLGGRAVAQSALPPTRLSPAGAIRAVQTSLRSYRMPPRRGPNLWTRLSLSLLDDYTRASPKTARNYPRQKHRKPPGHPQISPATAEQIQAAKAFRENSLGLWLTA